jgi:hypothetical protein
MSQSNVIFAFIFLAFLFFITARGELRKYMGYLLSTPTPQPGTPGSPLGNSAFNPSNMYGFK